MYLICAFHMYSIGEKYSHYIHACMFSLDLTKTRILFLNLVSTLGFHGDSQVPEEQKELNSSER